MNNKLSLSIIIPFHNRVSLLKKTLNSILSNLDDDYEIILIDDGSTIDTYSILNHYINDKILYYKIKNSERGFARNYGAIKSNGNYLNFFDSDDIAFPNHVSSFKQFIKINNNPIIFSNSYSINNIANNSEKKIILNGELNKYIFKNNILSCNSVFIERNFFLSNKFSNNINLSGSEDWDLWLRLANKEKIYGNRIISSALNNHMDRSTKKQDTSKIILRLDELNKRILDKNIINLNSKNLKSILSEIYSFKSLVLSPLLSKKKESISKLLHSILYRPSRLLELRTYIIIKNILFKFIL